MLWNLGMLIYSDACKSEPCTAEECVAETIPIPKQLLAMTGYMTHLHGEFDSFYESDRIKYGVKIYHCADPARRIADYRQIAGQFPGATSFDLDSHHRGFELAFATQDDADAAHLQGAYLDGARLLTFQPCRGHEFLKLLSVAHLPSSVVPGKVMREFLNGLASYGRVLGIHFYDTETFPALLSARATVILAAMGDNGIPSRAVLPSAPDEPFQVSILSGARVSNLFFYDMAPEMDAAVVWGTWVFRRY